MAKASKPVILAVALLAACTTREPQPDPALSCAPAPIEVAAKAPDKPKPSPNPDRGMGGTGLYVQNTANDRGMGGTGIVGTVTGFGSICVNGFRVAYDSDTAINFDGEIGPVTRLARGKTVVVDAIGSGKSLAARSIAVQSALVGPVTAASAETIRVMSATIGRDAMGAAPADIRIGDVVAVSGLQRADGSLVVTRIESVSTRTALVRGYVTETSSTMVVVGGVTVKQTEAMAAVGVGAWVNVVGDWTDGALEPRSVTIGPEVPVTAARVSIEGFVERGPDGRYMVRGMPVGANMRAGLDSPTIASLVGANRVQVLGQVERSQSVTPSTIVVPELMNPVERPSINVPTPRPAIQNMRGIYGRPLDPSLRPQGLPQRPATVGRPANVPAPAVRPEVPVRPETPGRPETPVRPETPTRPDTTTRPARPGVGG